MGVLPSGLRPLRWITKYGTAAVGALCHVLVHLEVAGIEPRREQAWKRWRWHQIRSTDPASRDPRS